MQLCNLIWRALRTLYRVGLSIPALKANEFHKRGARCYFGVMLTRQQCCWAKLILWLTDKPRLLLFCFSVLFHMFEAPKQSQNNKKLFCFGFVLDLLWICFALFCFTVVAALLFMTQYSTLPNALFVLAVSVEYSLLLICIHVNTTLQLPFVRVQQSISAVFA